MQPEQTYIAITRPDGRVSVMGFVTKSYRGSAVEFEREASEENVNAEILKSGLDAVSWRHMTAKETEDYKSADRTFRNAWKSDFTVDMDKAREIHKNRLRDERTPILQSLDVEFIKAMEINDKVKQSDIVSKKEALRNVTDSPKLAAAETPEQLKALTLEEILK